MWDNLCKNFVYNGRWKLTLFIISLFFIIAITINDLLLHLVLPNIITGYKNVVFLVCITIVGLQISYFIILIFWEFLLYIVNKDDEKIRIDRSKKEILIYLHALDNNHRLLINEIITRNVIEEENIFPLQDNEAHQIEWDIYNPCINNDKLFKLMHRDKLVEIDTMLLEILKEKNK